MSFCCSASNSHMGHFPEKFDEEDNPLVAEVKFTEASLSLRKRLQACIGIDKELGDAKLTLGHSQYKTSTENSIFKSALVSFLHTCTGRANHPLYYLDRSTLYVL
uniref:Uncharacterized protein n=1 Tax=Timema monikensis TaxID=170555 RepID=A0A7R9HPN6_9NEOP|nr:unnamed protein product [Timema monikensis]